MKVDLAAFKVDTDERVEPGATITSFRGENATLVRATRANMPGKTGKVLVKWDANDPANFDLQAGAWPQGFQMEYYAGVFDLEVRMVEPPPASERTVSIDWISETIRSEAKKLRSHITVYKMHPSYNTRANLKVEYNRLAGMFALGLRLNNFDELPGNTREAVNLCQEKIESLYKKAGK